MSEKVVEMLKKQGWVTRPEFCKLVKTVDGGDLIERAKRYGCTVVLAGKAKDKKRDVWMLRPEDVEMFRSRSGDYSHQSIAKLEANFVKIVEETKELQDVFIDLRGKLNDMSKRVDRLNGLQDALTKIQGAVMAMQTMTTTMDFKVSRLSGLDGAFAQLAERVRTVEENAKFKTVTS